MDDPDRYYMERIAAEVGRGGKDSHNDLTSMMQASRIYKAGLIVTYIPRKARDVLRQIKKNWTAERV
jgi:hypothetical protein